MKRITSIFFLISLFLLGCSSAAADAGNTSPFGHIYRITDVSVSDGESDPERMLIHLDAFRNFWIMEDTATYDFVKTGEFKESKLENSDTGHDRWIIDAENGGSILYELTADETGAAAITHFHENAAQYTWQLERVDMVSANVSSAGTREFLEIDWFFTDTYAGDLLQLSSGHIHRKGKIGFSVEDETIETLTVTEEYYTDGSVEYTQYPLTKADGFHIDAVTKYDAGEQYAVYRIPYKNGEFVFYVKYD